MHHLSCVNVTGKFFIYLFFLKNNCIHFNKMKLIVSVEKKKEEKKDFRVIIRSLFIYRDGKNSEKN